MDGILQIQDSINHQFNSVVELEQCSGYDEKAGEMDLLEIKGN